MARILLIAPSPEGLVAKRTRQYATRLGFRWTCQTRVDSIDEDLLKLMRQSGCELIHFGVEAGNPEILRRTQKGVDQEAIRKGFEAARRVGIKTAGFFMLGFPGEALSHYQQTLEFALELNPTYASFHPLLPIPGSPLFEEKFGKGPYWDEPIPLHRTYFTPARELEISRFIRKAYLRFYLRPGYIWNLLVSRSWKDRSSQFRLFLGFTNQKCD